MGNSSRIHYAIFLAASVLAFPASAGLFGGVGKLVALLDLYRGRPAQELFDDIGYPDKQQQVLDDLVMTGGFESENGPSCVWKIVVGPDRMVKRGDVFGNAWGCDMLASRVKKARKAHGRD